MGKGEGKGSGDPCKECGGCHRCPGLHCNECGRCGENDCSCDQCEQCGKSRSKCECAKYVAAVFEPCCNCPECSPDDYEDSPTYTSDLGSGDKEVSFRKRVCQGCEFCVASYCEGYTSCECPKCKPEKYDRLIVTLAKADGCKEFVRKWDELNWRKYRMDGYEEEYYQYAGGKISKLWEKWIEKDDDPSSSSEKWSEEDDDPSPSSEEDGDEVNFCRLMMHHQKTWGRRWCRFKSTDDAYWSLVKECVEKLGDTIDESSEDSEADWMHLEPKDKEEVEAYENRVKVRRMLNGVAKRERQRAGKEQKMKKEEKSLLLLEKQREREMEDKRKALMKSSVLARLGAPVGRGGEGEGVGGRQTPSLNKRPREGSEAVEKKGDRKRAYPARCTVM